MSGDDDSPENARLAVVECEREIQQIKAALRKFGSASDETQNSLVVTWTGIDNEELKTEETIDVSLQLSSPIEEAVLKGVSSSSDETAAAAEDSSSSTTFSGVETSVATLTATLRKNGQVLGNSESYDLAPLCKLEDAMNPKEEYVTELAVAIITPEEFAKTPTATTKTSDEKSEEDAEKPASSTEGGGDEAPKATETGEEEKVKEEESMLIKPLCTLSLKIVYKPSAKDQKEELYEILNKASQRKSQALGKLRGAQQGGSGGDTSKSSSDKSAAVKAGFLNKKPKKKQDEGKIMQLYNKYLGPNSMARVIFPVAKNYLIFFGAVIICHFKGHDLALPAPV